MLLRPGVLLRRGAPEPSSAAPPGGAVRLLPGGWSLAAADDGPRAGEGVLRRAGPITADERWSGVVHVTGDVIVLPGVTLEIAAGTIVLLAHHRRGNPLDRAPYDEPGALDVRGGRLIVRGTESAPVWFTSDAPDLSGVRSM